MRYFRHQTTKNGMTLIEIMVSVFLITLLTAAVLTLLIQNMRMGKSIDYSYAAVNIAKNRIDRIRQLRRDQGFSNLAASAEKNTRVNRNGLPDSSGDFTRTTKIQTNFAGYMNLTRVEVTVSYAGTPAKKVVATVTGYGEFIGYGEEAVPTSVDVTLSTLISPHI